jgi:hypothetical protein
MLLTCPFIDLDMPFYRSGVSAQNPRQAASSDRTLAQELITFTLSSRKPRSSSRVIRRSHKRLPNTRSVGTNENRICDRRLYDAGSSNVPTPTRPPVP